MADTAAQLKAATDKHAAANKAYADAMAQVAENQKKVTALTPMVKPATDAIAPAKAALDAATANVTQARAAVDAATANLNRARQAVEGLRSAAPPAKQ
jgi:predicted  nucleic acid-binding Zn-ribbon protein